MLSAHLWERDTLVTAKMDNILLLPSGKFCSAVGDNGLGAVKSGDSRELLLDLPTLTG